MTTAQENSYFQELELQLHRAGFTTRPPNQDGFLPVEWQDRLLCQVTDRGGVRYRPQDTATPEANAAKELVVSYARTVAEYMKMMEQAPHLKADGLQGDYRILTDFNNVVLAGHPTEYGTQFVTWEWSHDRKSVYNGDYSGFGCEGYLAKKQSFAIRSGMIPAKAIFTPEQLTDLYECVRAERQVDQETTFEYEKRLEKLQEQIEELVPGVQNHGSLETGKVMTVREFLTQNPRATVSMMTPNGYCHFTPDDAKRALDGEKVMMGPGVSGCDIEEDAGVFLEQEILSGSLSGGVWHLLTDYPSQSMESSGPQMGGIQ